MAKYEYPGGFTDVERPIIEKFEDEILPYCTREGPKIGEAAMLGDKLAADIVKRTHLFINGLPEFRKVNFNLLVDSLKRWQAR